MDSGTPLVRTGVMHVGKTCQWCIKTCVTSIIIAQDRIGFFDIEVNIRENNTGAHK